MGYISNLRSDPKNISLILEDHALLARMKRDCLNILYSMFTFLFFNIKAICIYRYNMASLERSKKPD